MLRLAFCLVLTATDISAEIIDTSAGRVNVTAVVTGLDTPWAVGFLPGGGLLITERDGRLLHVSKSGTYSEVQGLPKVAAVGQGGLLDVLVPNDFAATGEVFFSYARAYGSGAGTSVLRGRLSADRTRLEEAETIFSMTNPTGAGRHFGSRLGRGRRWHAVSDHRRPGRQARGPGSDAPQRLGSEDHARRRAG